MEQRSVIKFYFKLGKTATQTFNDLKKVYGNECLALSKVFEWYKQFKEGRESVQDEIRSGRPSTTSTDDKTDKIRTLLAADCHLSCRMLEDESGIPKSTVHELIRNVLHKRKICSKFVPHSLTPEQKEQRLNSSQNFIDLIDEDASLLDKIITGDESWVYQYDPTTKKQSSEWVSSGEPRPTKVRATKSKTKTMLITFFDSQGIVHKEFVPPGTTVTANYYLGTLDRLCKRIQRVQPERWESRDFFLFHDNAPAHTAGSVIQFLTKKCIPVLHHPPYSLDLAPCDFFLFPKLKSAMKGIRFDDILSIKAAVTRALGRIPKEAFSRSFQWLYELSERCIVVGEDYVETSRE